MMIHRHHTRCCLCPMKSIIRALIFFSMRPGPQKSTLFPYTTLFRSYIYISRYIYLYRYIYVYIYIYIRSEEHTSELQSLRHLVCRLLLEKKNKFVGDDDVFDRMPLFLTAVVLLLALRIVRSLSAGLG